MIRNTTKIAYYILLAIMLLVLPGCQNSTISPLCRAIIDDKPDLTVLLIKSGVDVNAGSGCAIYAAISRGQVEIVELLLKNGVELNKKTEGDNTVIMGATSPLEAAVISRKIEILKMLIEYGANPKNDFHAFSAAINFGDIAMAKLLLHYGVDPNMTPPAVRNIYGHKKLTPTSYQQVIIAQKDLESDRIHATASQYQCNMSGPESLLYYAFHPGSPDSKHGRDSIAIILLDHGADPDVRTINGTTPLMLASSQHNHLLIRKLLLSGADLHATDLCNRTAFDYVNIYPDHSYAEQAGLTETILLEYNGKN